MNKIKNILIATVFLATLLHFPFILCLSEDAEQVLGQADTTETEDLITEPITSEEALLRSTSSEGQVPQEETIKTPSATAQWDNHLDALKEKDQYWNQNSNIPTNDWKEKAISLAKETLDKDKNSADALKSAFFNAITEKIKIEEGEFTASTYALIKEFDDAIDAYATTLKAAEEATQEPEQKEEEPIVAEPNPTPPLSDEALAKSEVEEIPVTPVEAPAAAPAEPTRDVSQEWQEHLETIAITGSNDAANKSMLFKAYDLAKELLSQGYTGESLLSGLIYVLKQHNNNPHLLRINEMQAIEAFSAETGIAIPDAQKAQAAQQEYAMQQQAAQQEIAKKQKEAAAKIAILEKINEQAPGPKTSETQELVARIKRDLAADYAAEQAKMKARLEQMQQELIALHKTKEKETSAEQGIVERAVGAVKGAASAATAWWYGEESQEQKDIAALDKAYFAKLQEILTTKKLMPEQKLAIEERWNTFIHGLRSFKNLDIDDKAAATKWLVTMQQALDFLIFTHAIISIKVAMNITKEAIKQYPYSTEFISDIEIYLTQKQQKIIDVEEREKNAEVNKIREREQRKQLAEAKKQKIIDVEERKRNTQNIIDVYKNKEQEWQQLLAQIIQHKTATDQNNITYTNEAIKIAEFLLHPMKPVIVANKRDLGEKLKQEFTNALLQQQKSNENKINIYQNGIDQFYAEIGKMI